LKFRITKELIKYHDTVAVDLFFHVANERVKEALLKLMAFDNSLTFSEAVDSLLDSKEVMDLFVDYYNRPENIKDIAKKMSNERPNFQIPDEVFEIDADFVAHKDNEVMFYAFLNSRIAIYFTSRNVFDIVRLIIDDKIDNLIYRDSDDCLREFCKLSGMTNEKIVAEAYRDYLAEKELLK